MVGCPVSDVVYLNSRHYDPSTGVFLSVDPLVKKTMEPYIYGAANPVRFSDPSGLDPDTSAEVRSRVEANGGCTYSSSTSCWVRKAEEGGSPNVTGSLVNEQNRRTAEQLRGVYSTWAPSAKPGEPQLPELTRYSDYVPRPVAEVLKGLGVGAAAVGSALLVCTATGCVVVAAAGFGVAWNVLASETLDCAYDQCGEVYFNEFFGDAAQGALIGGTSGYLRVNVGIQLGSDKTAIGFVDAIRTYGPAATLDAASQQFGELGVSLLTRLLIREIFD